MLILVSFLAAHILDYWPMKLAESYTGLDATYASSIRVVCRSKMTSSRTIRKCKSCGGSANGAMGISGAAPSSTGIW